MAKGAPGIYIKIRPSSRRDQTVNYWTLGDNFLPLRASSPLFAPYENFFRSGHLCRHGAMTTSW